MFIAGKIKHSTRKYMRSGDQNEVPSGCIYSEAKPFWGGVSVVKHRAYVVNWGVRDRMTLTTCSKFLRRKKNPARLGARGIYPTFHFFLPP